MNKYEVVFLDHETKMRHVIELHAFDKEDVYVIMLIKYKVKDKTDILKINLKQKEVEE